MGEVTPLRQPTDDASVFTGAAKTNESFNLARWILAGMPGLSDKQRDAIVLTAKAPKFFM